MRLGGAGSQPVRPSTTAPRVSGGRRRTRIACESSTVTAGRRSPSCVESRTARRMQPSATRSETTASRSSRERQPRRSRTAARPWRWRTGEPAAVVDATAADSVAPTDVRDSSCTDNPTRTLALESRSRRSTVSSSRSTRLWSFVPLGGRPLCVIAGDGCFDVLPHARESACRIVPSAGRGVRRP
jgi:hypothetical protein